MSQTRVLRVTLITVFFMSMQLLALGQNKDSIHLGNANGVIRDSTFKYVLQAATVAVYSDSTLINYQLTNNYGEYHFTKLPIGTKLKLIVSNTGYTNKQVFFKIEMNKNEILIPEINLSRLDTNMLPEVIVKSIPPVRMNRDTLEFNADAFKLDKNAVVEDLLKKLPGITVWGDGTITVNGHEVNSLKVNGKTFMGGNAKIATQNLSKDIVDKVQVYRRNPSPSNPLDSTTEINIKLKKGKDLGYFGKLSSGAGTDRRYELLGNINYFNPRTQLSVVGDGNNVNKVAQDANELVSNSTFKGVGTNIEYQPDFRKQGLNKPRSGGFTFQHDFNKGKLDANYFIQKNYNNTFQNTKSLRYLSATNIQTEQDNSSNETTYTNQYFSSKYNKIIDKNNFNTSVSFYSNNNNNILNQESSLSDSALVMQSSNQILNSIQSSSKNISLNAGLIHTGNVAPSIIRSKHAMNYTINYSFSHSENNSINSQKTFFKSLQDPSLNKLIERSYDNSGNNQSHFLLTKLSSLSPWIFGTNGFLPSIQIELSNSLKINSENTDNHVSDLDTISSMYKENEYLTVSAHYTTINETPALNFSKAFYHSLANRYDKGLNVNVGLQGQFYFQRNTSSHSFQDFSRNYRYFIPNAAITYNNYQFGAFQDNYILSFVTSAGYPTSNALYPLVDSSNSYYLSLGNSQLRPYGKKEVSFSFTHKNYMGKNTYNYNLNTSFGTIDNYFADSTITDSLGRTKHYSVNANGNKYVIFEGGLNKAFKFHNDQQLQFSLNSRLKLSTIPNSVNNIWNKSNLFNNDSYFKIYYTLKDLFAIEGKQSLSYYHSRQDIGEGNMFSNSNQETSLSASINISKRLNFSSNANYNHTTSTGSAAVNFTIWNAGLTYRLLSGNNLECKFYALDLLHQNKSISNYGDNNIISQSRNNVLQQYFMLTLSFYPRQFGKKEER